MKNGPVVSSSDNYDNDDSNVTIRAKLEPCGWKGYEKREQKETKKTRL